MIRLFTRPAIAVLLTGATLVPGSLYASQATDLLLSKARSLEGRGLMDLAARAWEQVLLADPSNTEALAGLARAAKMNGKKAEADRYLEKLRAVDPQNPGLVRIGGMQSADQQRGSLEEAQRLAQKHDFEGAMRIYRQVFGNEPPPGNWSIAYYETQAATADGWADATAALERLSKKYPDSQEYALSLGRLLTYRPKTRIEGIRLLEAIKGDSALVSKARSAWRQALIWDAGSASSAASLREYLGRYPDAELAKLLNGKEQAAGTAVPKEQAVEHVRDGRGYQALGSGKLKQAEQEFAAEIKAAPRDSKALSGLGYVRMKEQNFAEAASLFQQALTADPKNKTLASALETATFWNYMKQGSDALETSRPADAVQNFKQALNLRPQDADAARALAGSYEAQKQYALAVPVYVRVTQGGAAKPDDWYSLARAQYNAGEASSALKSLQQVAPTIQDGWTADPERAALLAFIHADAGDSSTARALADRAQQLAANGSGTLPASAQLQFAGLYLRLNQPMRAAGVYENIVKLEPANGEAWGGLLNTLIQASKLERAQTVLDSIPADVYQQMLKQPAFLRSVATLQSALNRGDRAEVYLQKALELETASGQGSDPSLKLQLADLWARNGKTAEAERLLRRTVDEQPSNPAAWVSYLSALHEQKRDKEALQVIDSVPDKVFSTLAGDAAFITIEAGIYSNLGRYPEALRAIRSLENRFDLERKTVPAGLKVQEAWILLNSGGSDRELYAILSHYSGEPGLTEAQQQDFNSIWSAWVQRRAKAASDRGDFSEAVKILAAAGQFLPADMHIKAALAGAYLEAGDARDAYAIYKDWGLKDAGADDFSAAIGAALTVKDKGLAERWLSRGLKKFPRDARLLSLAGKQAAEQGDYDRAKVYLREALAVSSLENGSRSKMAALANDAHTSQRALGALLVGDDAIADQSEPVRSFAAPRRPERGTGADLVSSNSFGGNSFAAPQNDLDMRPARTASSRLDRDPDPVAFLPKSAARMTLESANPIVPTNREPSLEEQIGKDLGALNSRNSPYFTNGTTVQSRTGQGGLDKLMIQEADLEASTTIGNKVRLSLLAKPTYLDSGSAATTNTLGFGSQTGSAVSDNRSAFGIGAEAQISTQNVGVRLGLSPNNFLVHNWIGGLRINPGHGPFTLLLNRDTVRDTKLSFAGERDSTTNQVWGGVIANSASILGNWGDDKSGFYTSVGYQALRGKGVASNNRVDASMGAYFKILSTKEGSLTAGLNFSGMHYDKNLRYFTLGQGGYFSPQQYFLANIPIRWTGSWNQVLQYSISGSLGVQHFSEDNSPYFPLQDPLGARGKYASMASTGGNYNLDFRVGYQLAPQWIAGAYVNVGNARNYRNASAGIFLRYLFQPRPMGSEISADSIPDWKGGQPFGLPLN